MFAVQRDRHADCIADGGGMRFSSHRSAPHAPKSTRSIWARNTMPPAAILHSASIRHGPRASSSTSTLALVHRSSRSTSLTRDADNVWSVAVQASNLQAAGIGKAVYVRLSGLEQLATSSGIRPKGSAAGFITDVDGTGNRFNPNKLLFDPYALEFSHDPLIPTNNGTAVYATGANNRTLDSGRRRPKGIVLAVDTSKQEPNRPAPSRMTSSTECMCAA